MTGEQALPIQRLLLKTRPRWTTVALGAAADRLGRKNFGSVVVSTFSCRRTGAVPLLQSNPGLAQMARTSRAMMAKYPHYTRLDLLIAKAATPPRISQINPQDRDFQFSGLPRTSAVPPIPAAGSPFQIPMIRSSGAEIELAGFQ